MRSVTRRRFLNCAVLICCVLGASGNCLAGVVIVVGDEWLLTDEAFAGLPTETSHLALNIAALMSPGRPGNFLVYDNAGAPSGGALTGASLRSIMTDAGYTWTADNTAPFNAGTLSSFDGILIAGTIGSGDANADVLAEYVKHGGSVLIEGATGDFLTAAAEAAAWNPFLGRFGLAFGDTWFDLMQPENVSAEPGTHALRSGVDKFLWGYGQTAFELDPANPLTDVAIMGNFPDIGSKPVVAVSTIPEPATIWIVGSCLLLLLRTGKTEGRTKV
jgi:hypothetical protein